MARAIRMEKLLVKTEVSAPPSRRLTASRKAWTRSSVRPTSVVLSPRIRRSGGIKNRFSSQITGSSSSTVRSRERMNHLAI